MITFVLTSCGRFMELENTLKSFFKFNTANIDNYIIIEDSGCDIMRASCLSLNERYNNIFTFIFNEERIGQIKSIDKAYTLVKTKYIFHCEDDWEFYRSGFVEDSIVILEDNPEILNVWLRKLDDTNGHTVLQNEYSVENVQYRLLDNCWREGWGGFSFNPGLRRLSDYKILAPYSRTVQSFPQGRQKFYTPELEISIEYSNLGFYSAILKSDAVRHTGWGKQIL